MFTYFYNVDDDFINITYQNVDDIVLHPDSRPFLPLSIRLSDLLDEIGTGKCTVMERRDTYLQRERMMTIAGQLMETNWEHFHFESQSKGTTTPGINSDIDLLQSAKRVNIMTDWRDWDAGVDNLLMLRDDITPPQQYLLKVISTGDQYLR
ncbi:hypothetical protein DPMN_114174 [Dreissena polymorpha]|uniref:Uncharacterized protein n=1 Tax=Dreissena polymorpha TaxID=45954 RepID=A0A9D4QRR1_DREPO|nr:hypothetical protein DPMN_114174 [Dreissena polymorpha]